MTTRVLMLGWDFPPMARGGLGFACSGLSRALADSGVYVTFVLPRTQPVDSRLRFLFADVPRYGGGSGPYVSSYAISSRGSVFGKRHVHNRFLAEVLEYARQIPQVIAGEDFDIIHAHDWTTYAAGIAAKRFSGKPLILHVHITSFDQSGGVNVDPEIYALEQEAFNEANVIIAISNYVKRTLVERYGVPEAKVSVVHNGADEMDVRPMPPALDEFRRRGMKIVLSVGRITLHKGVDYFVSAARKVLDQNDRVMFVVVGDGDMLEAIVGHVARLGMSDHFIFTGWLSHEDIMRLYQSSDLFVMPSVSEPFGLVPLESLRNGTPVLISKQSGVSEVLTHALKVDFWDVEEMANKILAVLEHPELYRALKENGARNALGITWRAAAQKVIELYDRLLRELHLRHA